MEYFIKTFGCQMNISDSERIASFLESQNFKLASDIKKATVVIFNTCGVRKSAEDRAFGLVHNLRKSNPDVKIVLTGCLAKRKDVITRMKSKVDLFCEIKDFSKNIPVLLDIKNKTNKDYLSIIPKCSKKHTALVPIMTGCNNFCSYCVVPYARGREISRETKEILGEIKKLIKKNYKEIILLGQNVNSYKSQHTNFPKLLKLIEKIPGDFRISFMSSHPKDYSDELIETITKSKKICEHIHLPLQAGSTEILKKMNRKYSTEDYLNLAQKIKKAFQKNKPDVLYSITTDIIVGFPGETKKQFLQSATIMKKVGYDMVFFGQFSPRPGTVAYNMKDNVKKAEKVRRENFLNEILKKTTSANNKKYTGKILEVLIDKKDGENYFGRTRTMKNVKVISKKKNLVGKIITVKITKANTWNLEAETIK